MLILFFLILCFLGMILIVLKKIPVLIELSAPIQKEGVFRKIGMKFNGSKSSTYFSGAAVLQKTLSKIRVLALKSECKLGKWLEQLRHKTNEKKKDFSDNYWQKLRRK